MDGTLCNNLAAGWHGRAARLDKELAAALKAPALWTPERVQHLQVEISYAKQQARLWTIEALS